MRRLSEIAFEDPARAEREISGLTRGIPPAVLERIDLLLAASPAPEQGLQYFARLRERQAPAFDHLTRSPAGLRYLTAVFTNSHFLSEEVLEHPAWAEELLSTGDLHRVLDADEYQSRLDAALAPGLPSPLDLAQFRRRQMLRIVVRDVLGLGTLPVITSELSALADAILETACQRIHADLVRRFGETDATFLRRRAGKTGRRRAQLQLGYRPDVPVLGKRRDARPLFSHQ